MTAADGQAVENDGIGNKCRRSTTPTADEHDSDLATLASLLGSGKKWWPCPEQVRVDFPMRHTSGPCVIRPAKTQDPA